MTALPQGKALDAVALRAQAGDKDALDLLLRGLERLLWTRAIARTANRYGLWHVVDDLKQMAYASVVRWLPLWDPAIAQASTYLATNAKWELFRSARELAVPVHVPNAVWDERRHVPALLTKRSRGEALTEPEAAVLERARHFRAARRTPAAIHAHDGEEGSTDFMLAAKEEAPAAPREEMAALLGVLTDRERFVIDRRFGFLDGREWTLEEVGEATPAMGASRQGCRGGLSRERVRQIEAKALEKMRRKLGAPLAVPHKVRQPKRTKLAVGA